MEVVAHTLVTRQAFAVVGGSLPWTSPQREMGCTFPGCSDTTDGRVCFSDLK